MKCVAHIKFFFSRLMKKKKVEKHKKTKIKSHLKTLSLVFYFKARFWKWRHVHCHVNHQRHVSDSSLSFKAALVTVKRHSEIILHCIRFFCSLPHFINLLVWRKDNDNKSNMVSFINYEEFNRKLLIYKYFGFSSLAPASRV